MNRFDSFPTTYKVGLFCDSDRQLIADCWQGVKVLAQSAEVFSNSTHMLVEDEHGTQFWAAMDEIELFEEG